MPRINFTRNLSDMRVAILGSMGFSTSFIQARTGFTMGQVGYRLKKSGVKRSDYRNGQSKLAGIVLSGVEVEAVREVRRRLRQQARAVPKAVPKVYRRAA